ncbi:hypothetical protein [Azotobacter beijerinckii]|uniref:hypothetical protein n=1 Tax=Azotobacter beijerinckii TaxID=170623 RepID=UPI00147DDB63|nr:hypothetical protein [Azotobacter beijerinckii]
MAIMLRRKAFHLDLPAPLGKHVAGGRGQLGLLLTWARHWVLVLFQHPQQMVLFIDDRHEYPLLDCVSRSLSGLGKSGDAT